MLYYPQFSGGSISQFPFARRTNVRTVTNESLDGSSVRVSDAGAGLVRWQLRYANLTDQEWSLIEQLFEAAEGRLNPFTFLDPADNLLMWSEDWTKPQWTADPLVQLSGGLQDPFAGTDAMQVTNTAQTIQRVTQLISAPGCFQYCYSVYLRSIASVTVDLVATATGSESVTPIAVGPAWMRAAMRATLTSQDMSIKFGLQLPSGSAIEAFGAQVEAQLTAGLYKKTTNQSGVYSATRFDSDSLLQSTDAPNQNSCIVKLVSRPA